MTDRRARRLAWSAFTLWLLLVLASAGFAIATALDHGPSGASQVPFGLVTAAFPVVAILILSRQPRNRIGWILMAIGLGWAIGPESYGAFALRQGLPGGALAVAIDGPSWAAPVGIMGTFLLLRFPDGKLLSPRWRKVEWLSAIAIIVTTFAIMFAPGDLTDSGYPNLANPLGIDALKPVIGFLIPFLLLIPLTIVASAVSLVRRFRRSTGVARLQLKWLTTAGAILAVLYLVAMVASIGTSWNTKDTPTWVGIIQNLATLAFVLIPISIGFAVLKHRLYEIDVVINKTVVYGTMAAFITAAYVVMVVGVGALVGRGSEPNLFLSILATAVVAVAFGPVKQRVQHLANRLVYGKRSTPYEVLSQFSGRMAGALATEDALPTLAQTLAEATGAATAEVWLVVRDELRLEASWPGAAPLRPASVPAGETPDAGPGGLATPVRHQGQTLGCLVVRRSVGEPVTPAETKLVGDLAAQAGLVLRNVGLIEDLRSSRQRLVAAQDSERRRLERNIHDGAQQRLVALAVRFNLAQRLARNGQAEVMATLGAQTQAALENLRDLARGIYPPLLADQGLVAALQAQAAKVSVPTRVEASGVGRYPQEVEAALYFCCLEALQNVAKYAEASRVEIHLRDSDGELAVEVEDDGKGFDPAVRPRGSGLTNMQDRLAVVGGSLEVRSRPGNGTRLEFRIPARRADAVDRAGLPRVEVGAR